METEKAFAMARASQGQPRKVFDWGKAAQRIKEQQPTTAGAGLQSDWEYTGGKIWKDGKPVLQEDTYTFLRSTWATPELEMDGVKEDCFIMEDTTEWDADTYWPPEALEIIGLPKEETDGQN